MLSVNALINDYYDINYAVLEDATGIAYDGNNIDFLYATGKELYQKLYDELHQLHKLDTETFEEYVKRIKRIRIRDKIAAFVKTIERTRKNYEYPDEESYDIDDSF